MSNTLKKKKGYKIGKTTGETFYQKQEILKEHNKPTYEKVETIPLLVIKKDSTREQYDRSKIEAGVVSACYKRAIPTEAIHKTVEKIETEIFKREEKEIPTSVIGEIVMEYLK